MTDWAPTNPFEGSGQNLYDFTSTDPVDLNQFEAEISSKSGVAQDDLMVSSTVADPDRGPSASNLMTIFVASQVPLKESVVQAILDDHTPAPQPVPVATDPTGVQITSDDPALPDLLEKLRSGETLTTKELSLVVKSIVGG